VVYEPFLESILLDTMYELPSLQNVTKVIIDKNILDNTAQTAS
jgi:ATP-dependent protease Clp ATPase subunit